MLIDHLTFSKTGGAGRVAATLSEIQSLNGHDSKLLSIIDKNLWQDPLRLPVTTARAVVDKYILSNRSEPTLFSCARSFGQSFEVEKLRTDAVLHLHWVEGVISPNQITTLLRSGKRIVWTLHDMVPFTGGCHYSHDCFGYESDCSNCPQVRSAFQPAVSRSHSNKNVFEFSFPNLTVVATTEWMAEKARQSKIFSNSSVVVIPNPVSYEIFSKASAITSDTGVKPKSPNQLKLVLIANDLADETKGVEKLLGAAQAARVLSGSKISLTLIGKNGHRFANNEGIDCRGELTQSQISECLLDCDALISASVAESFGLTIVEAAILGIPSIVLGSSGSSELVAHGVTGWVVEDFAELTQLLCTLAQGGSSALEESGIRAKAVAIEKYSPSRIAEAYQKLYLAN